MISRNSVHKIIRYFQLLTFITYLTHGFIPHHHHHEKGISCSYDISLGHNHEDCSCHGTSFFESDSEAHSNCLLCSQLDKEFHNHGLFFKEPVLAIQVIFSDDGIVFSDKEIEEKFPLFDDFDLIADAVIQGHGLRAPPIS